MQQITPRIRRTFLAHSTTPRSDAQHSLHNALCQTQGHRQRTCSIEANRCWSEGWLQLLQLVPLLGDDVLWTVPVDRAGGVACGVTEHVLHVA